MKTLADAIDEIGEEKFAQILKEAIFEAMSKMSPEELKDAFCFKGMMSEAERNEALAS